MKKSIFMLAAFVVLNVAAQTSDPPATKLAFAKQRAPVMASMQVQLNTDKDQLKIRANLPILEIAVEDLYQKTLIRKKNSNTIKLTSLSRGVYTLVVRLEGTTFRKRILLE